jgi:nicotinamide-nucleotide amidase
MSRRLAVRVLTLARARGLRLATAESCTGGKVLAALTDIAGSSDVVEGGYVTYSNALKVRLLGVRDDVLRRHGAVSEACARAMAEGALAGTEADLAVSVTGIAGPGGGSPAKPEGMVCFALARASGATETVTHRFGAIGRAGVRKAAVEVALGLFLAAIREKSAPAVD